MVFLVACGGPTGMETSPDASMTPSDGSGSGSAMCKAKATSPGSGHHNAGRDCMGSCHNHGFTAAGTIVTAAGGSSAAVGATIQITDANNHVTTIVSQNNGNFYTSTSLAYPIKLEVTECPSLTPMVQTVPSAQGCNSSSCHGGAQGSVHL